MSPDLSDLGVAAPTRTVRCDTPQCESYGTEHEVTATAAGPFWSWPNLVCVCGAEPRIVDHPSWPWAPSFWAAGAVSR